MRLTGLCRLKGLDLNTKCHICLQRTFFSPWQTFSKRWTSSSAKHTCEIYAIKDMQSCSPWTRSSTQVRLKRLDGAHAQLAQIGHWNAFRKPAFVDLGHGDSAQAMNSRTVFSRLTRCQGCHGCDGLLHELVSGCGLLMGGRFCVCGICVGTWDAIMQSQPPTHTFIQPMMTMCERTETPLHTCTHKCNSQWMRACIDAPGPERYGEDKPWKWRSEVSGANGVWREPENSCQNPKQSFNN